MSWMTPNMQMETSWSGGVWARPLAGPSVGNLMFVNYYTCTAGEGLIAFSSRMPGRILPMSIAPGAGNRAQKSAFLAAEAGGGAGTFFARASTAFFGGEGFVFGRSCPVTGWLSWRLTASVVEYDLAPGQSLR